MPKADTDATRTPAVAAVDSSPADSGPVGPVLRVSRVHYPVTVLGVGRRLGIWLQGCPLACRGCMSHDTWDAAGGQPVAVATLTGLWRQAVADGADGLTISGGEPLAQAEALGALLASIEATRAEATQPGGVAFGRDLDILVFTGYDWAELDTAQQAAVAVADVLITGRYIASDPTTLVWRGSGNQQLLLRTPLGRRRYAEHVGRHAATPALQIDVGREGDIRIIGIPRAGEMRQLERALRERGATIGRPSWRPS